MIISLALRDERKAGEAEGKAETLLESTRALMQTMGWTAAEALRAMMVPEEEQARYLEILSKE